jgi:hypothetical protein
VGALIHQARSLDLSLKAKITSNRLISLVTILCQRKLKPDSRDLFTALILISISTSEQENQNTLPAAEQKLKIRLDTKHRAGKAVTLIEGFLPGRNRTWRNWKKS